ncbi:MAG: ECF transporter S component [Phycisphaerae bacterium]
MSSAISLRSGYPATTLPWLRGRSVVFQVLLVGSAVLLPALAHTVGAPVRWLLPMHWPVILAGLAYGPIAGLAVGVLAPLTSLATSGMPPVPYLYVMIAELALYGLATGWLRERMRWPAWAAVGAALIAGRIVAIAISAAMAGSLEIAAAGFTPGIPCALAQIALLPPLARWWVARESGRQSSRNERE